MGKARKSVLFFDFSSPQEGFKKSLSLSRQNRVQYRHEANGHHPNWRARGFESQGFSGPYGKARRSSHFREGFWD
jgi:hypothetical protein